MIRAMKTIQKLIPVMFLGVILLSLVAAPVKAESKPVEVLTGVRLVNVEKVDLAANTYKLDFYLWFSWDPSQITLKQIQDFEFLNGSPSKEVVYVTEAEGFVQYRVKGDFLKTFDFTRYPFETQDLQVKIEHKNMNSTELLYVADPDSSLDSGVNVVGWDLLSFKTSVVEHQFSGNSFSNFVFDLNVGRPFFSSLVKNVLPITVITIISLLTFVIHPKNFGQRIGLAVSTLMAASAIHLSLLNALPPTGYLTLADRMMLIVYIIFLFNLAVSVYIMRLVDKNKIDEAGKFNTISVKLLVALTVAMVAVQFFF
ncbi:MAG: hypothetical protein NTV61_01950 [Candidatus Bathyarchaeota archaeon]|nr:hypothetical protein [Candidatus Bathyarchaeota archaeon]